MIRGHREPIISIHGVREGHSPSPQHNVIFEVRLPHHASAVSPKNGNMERHFQAVDKHIKSQDCSTMSDDHLELCFELAINSSCPKLCISN